MSITICALPSASSFAVPSRTTSGTPPERGNQVGIGRRQPQVDQPGYHAASQWSQP
ncbi:MAG: hypothetical protein IJX36_04655 [Thermoguttaceae bacterium]|nr:hypothetical protein [Thermoguttaceae bacterium]